MARVERSDQSIEDLIDIWAYIAEGSLRAADDFIDEIERLFRLLARSPLSGRSRDELAPRLRSFPISDYVVFYLPRKNGVTITRVLSGYRDLDSLFES